MSVFLCVCTYLSLSRYKSYCSFVLPSDCRALLLWMLLSCFYGCCYLASMDLISPFLSPLCYYLQNITFLNFVFEEKNNQLRVRGLNFCFCGQQDFNRTQQTSCYFSTQLIKLQIESNKKSRLIQNNLLIKNLQIRYINSYTKATYMYDVHKKKNNFKMIEIE